VRRVVALIVAAVAAWLGIVSSGPAIAAATLSTQTYAYDIHHHPSATVVTASERGPPVTSRDHATSDNVVDRWSRGASARPDAATPPTVATYGDHATLVHATHSATTAQGLVGSLGRDLTAIPGSGVAAKACSFTGSTVVLMADGTHKRIEDIQVGDEVIATDPETGEQVAKTVEHVWVHDDTVVDLIVDSEVLTTTEDHPFWSVTDQRFERADELTGGEQVLGADGRVISVSGLRVGTAREALAYNLSVEGIHTFHVGQSEVLVHNTCIPWSSAGLGNVAGDLAAGARTANVANRSQAEELFLRLYQGKGFTNTTGMSGKQVRDFYGSKAGTYHWDTELTPGLTHSTGPHLQIHQPDGVIVRIFYGGVQ